MKACEVTGSYAALQRTSIDVVSVELADRHGGVLMRIHFDKGKATIRLQAGLKDITKILEERNKIVLRRVGSQVAHIACGLPLRRLLDDHVVALDTVCGEVVVAERRGRGDSHGSHRLLLRDGRLSLLVGPVAADGARTKPFAVHRAQRFVGIPTVTEGNKSISTRASSFHIPHHASLRYRTKRRESLEQHFIIHFVAQVTNKDMEMVRSILLVRAVGLVRPVDTDLLR